MLTGPVHPIEKIGSCILQAAESVRSDSQVLKGNHCEVEKSKSKPVEIKPNWEDFE